MLALLGVTAGLATAIYILLQCKVGTKPKAKSTWSKALTRELGLLERWYSASHATGVMLNFCTVVHGSSNEAIKQSDLEAAMRQVCEQLPMLKMTIVDDDKNPFFRPLVNLDYASQINVINRETETTWLHVVEKENMLGFDYALGPQPLWRLNLVCCPQMGDFELIFTVHHGVCDGRAGMFVTQAILDAYKRVRLSQVMPESKEIDTALAVPLDALVDCRSSLGYIAKLLTKHHFPSPSSDLLWLGADGDYASRTGRFLAGELTPNQSIKLLQRCREQGTTIQCFLVAAAQLAYFEAAQREKVLIECSVAVDNRAFITPRPSLERLGTFACDVRSTYLVDSHTQIWDLVRHAKTWSLPVICGARQIIGVLQFGGPFWKLLRELRDKKACGRTSAICVSNLGAISWQENYANITIKKARFAQLKVGEGPVFNVSVMTLLPQNVLAYSCAYCLPNVSDDQAVKFQNKFQQLLESA